MKVTNHERCTAYMVVDEEQPSIPLKSWITKIVKPKKGLEIFGEPSDPQRIYVRIDFHPLPKKGK